MAAVVARPNVQHPQRVPLGGLPAVLCSGALCWAGLDGMEIEWLICSRTFEGHSL